MSDGTAIEWTDATWNPVRGCSRISEGCRHCYAERIAARFSYPGGNFEGFARMDAHGPHWTGRVELLPSKLDEPSRWRNPRRVFVNSMSDLFHEQLTNETIATVLEAIRRHRARGHHFQILTKRADRLPEFFRWYGERFGLDWMMAEPPVWLGVSVEHQAAAEIRIEPLLTTPAGVHFLSCEPLLGPLDLSGWLPRLDWVIAGGESGPEARLCSPDWIRSLRDQCLAARVPFFFKQWGGARKCDTGRCLDGRTWDQLPVDWPTATPTDAARSLSSIQDEKGSS